MSLEERQDAEQQRGLESISLVHLQSPVKSAHGDVAVIVVELQRVVANDVDNGTDHVRLVPSNSVQQRLQPASNKERGIALVLGSLPASSSRSLRR